MAINIHVTIEGLNHALNFCSKFPGQYKTERRNSHNRLADKGIKIYQSHAHVDTGEMKNKIKKGKISENILEVTAQAGHSGHENKRGGNHAFFDRGTREFTDQIKEEEMNIAKRAVSRGGF